MKNAQSEFQKQKDEDQRVVQCMCVKTRGTKNNMLIFLQQKGKRRTQHGTVLAAARQGAPASGSAPQGNEHQGGNLQAEILENTEAPDLAQDTRHQLLPLHGFLNSVPWLEKTQHQQLTLFTLNNAGFPHPSP